MYNLLILLLLRITREIHADPHWANPGPSPSQRLKP